MIKFFKKVIIKIFNTFLNLFGLSVLRNNSQGWSPLYLRGYGNDVHTVIDVGAAHGTPNLYRAFRNKRFVLIEPLKEYEKELRNLGLLESYIFNCAAGDADGTAEITVNTDSMTKSSMLNRTTDIPGFQKQATKRNIDVRKIDGLMKENPEIFKPPFILKIDTEGYELLALKGAQEVLRLTNYVIAEVSVQKRFEESYTFAELIRFMDTQAFDVYDILHVNQRPNDFGVLYMDIIFKKNKL